MAVTRTLSNKFFFEQGKGAVDFATDEFRVILMDDAYTFDRVAHGIYGDVSASELATLYGYTQIDKVLVDESAWAQDDVNHKATLSWADPTWTAAGGSIGPSSGAIVLRYDSGTPANSLIIGHIGFGDNVTVTDGVSFQLQDTGFDLAQAA